MVTGAFVALAVVSMSSCGDDEDKAEPAVTEAPVTDAPATEAPTTGAAAEGDELCAIAAEMDQQDSLPTAEQLTQYQELAPVEISDAVAVAAGALLAAGDDMVATFNAIAVDEVQAALDEINAFETATCGIDHSDDGPPVAEGVSYEIENDAARVDVTATEYAFALESDTLASGRTSLVLVNDGAEAHFLAVAKLADGVTLEEAMMAEDPTGLIEGEWGTQLAAAGGEDEEIITLDLESGTYGFMCWIPGPDGTPHAILGMAQEVVVE